MKRLQAFKFQLMPNGNQQRNMHRFAGACRFVFNKALALQQSNHAQGISYMSYVKLAALLPLWKREVGFEWLSQVPSQSLQHALKDLDRAYQGFFAKRSGFPQFKKKHRHDTFRYPAADQFVLDQVNGRIKLPKLGWVRYRKSREVLGVCAYCERELLAEKGNIDHVRPKSKFPKECFTFTNYVVSCAAQESCNHTKADQEKEIEQDSHADLLSSYLENANFRYILSHALPTLFPSLR